MREKRLTAILATMVVCLGFAGCVGESEGARADAAELYSWKTAYVGDNSAVSRIARTVPYPANVEVDSIDIQSRNAPYGLTVNLAHGARADPNTLFTPAAATFALIGNLDNLTYENEQTGERVVVYTRAQVDETLRQQHRLSIEELGSAESMFKEFVGDV